MSNEESQKETDMTQLTEQLATPDDPAGRNQDFLLLEPFDELIPSVFAPDLDLQGLPGALEAHRRYERQTNC